MTKKLMAILLACALTLTAFPFGVFANTESFVVTFDSNHVNGAAPVSIEVTAGTGITLPDNPVIPGYTFVGWYLTPEGGQYQGFNPSENINGDLTLYAQWLEEDHVRYITTTDGDKTVTLGYSASSGVAIRKFADNSLVPANDLEAGKVEYGVFKDLNGNEVLDPYEDWRLDVETRTMDLAGQMSYAEIAGLMLYSSHQRSWNSPIPTQAQIAFLANDDLRHVLIAGEIPAHIAAPWNNTVQAITESIGLGIPANNSSDPRHSAAIGVEYYSSNTGTISLWPNSLGLAATFDPEVTFEFGKIASAEYRALGIATALSPQIDLATDPRWSRFNGTFGEDPLLAADMTRAYVQGFQGTFDEEGNLEGWGSDSVNAMIKHWPGGGGGEGGRDAHNDYGKYSVFPGNNFDAHTIPFVDGALQGSAAETTMATAVMPYYTISFNWDPNGDDVANAYNEYITTDLLRDRYSFDGVICTDWGVDATRGWGPDIEDLDTAERSKILIEAGVDQFGGRNTSSYILEAVELAQAEGTEHNFRQKMEESAARLLKNVFRPGLFENPYLVPEQSEALVANDQFVALGYEAQLKAVVMLKNKNSVLPVAGGVKVFVPRNDNGQYLLQGVEHHFTVVDSPDEADIALVSLGSPLPASGSFGGGWNQDSGYTPLTLQYSEYTATEARPVSIAGDYRNLEGSSKILNRSYKNLQNTPTNLSGLHLLLDTKEAMGDKPVIAVINMSHPMVFTEVDAVSDAIVARFASSDNAVLDVLDGSFEPSGLLPMQMPKNMATVESQFEDIPRDMEVYVDAEGNAYDFAFGLNWSGVIHDERVARYQVEPQAYPQSGPTTDAYPTVLTSSLPVGKIGEQYECAIQVLEDKATIAFVAGDLPEGLTFNNGVISGVPQAGTHELGNQITTLIVSPGKLSRVYRITLLVNEDGDITLPDPNDLSIAMTLAKSKRENNYSADTWTPFAMALGIAEAIYNSAQTTTQDVLDFATDQLVTATMGLVRQ